MSAFRLDFVGVGAARSGTSWLARCLGEHPQLWIPAIKELHYFDNDSVYEPTLTRLREAFRGAPEGRRLGEFTPRYLISPRALDRLHAAFPETRILVSLRDPVERAWSQYRYFRINMGKEPEVDFATALTGFYREDYLVKSLYAEALEGVFARWGRPRVHVMLFDDVGKDPRGMLRELFAFLGVDAGFVPRTVETTVNASRTTTAPPPGLARLTRWLTYSDAAVARGVRRALGGRVPRLGLPGVSANGSARLDPHTRRELYRRHFARDVEATERLLGRDLSSWKSA